MSWIAPSRAPMTSTCDVASRHMGMAASDAVPAATSVTVSRYIWASRAESSASTCKSSDIEQSPSFERAAQGHLVGVLEVPTHRQPRGQPGDANSHRAQEPGKVAGGGLALEVGISGDDHLGHLAIGEPGHELLDAKVVGTDTFD